MALLRFESYQAHHETSLMRTNLDKCRLLGVPFEQGVEFVRRPSASLGGCARRGLLQLWQLG